MALQMVTRNFRSIYTATKKPYHAVTVARTSVSLLDELQAQDLEPDLIFWTSLGDAYSSLIFLGRFFFGMFLTFFLFSPSVFPPKSSRGIFTLFETMPVCLDTLQVFVWPRGRISPWTLILNDWRFRWEVAARFMGTSSGDPAKSHETFPTTNLNPWHSFNMFSGHHLLPFFWGSNTAYLWLGGGFKCFLFSPLFEEDSQFD